MCQFWAVACSDQESQGASSASVIDKLSTLYWICRPFARNVQTVTISHRFADHWSNKRPNTSRISETNLFLAMSSTSARRSLIQSCVYYQARCSIWCEGVQVSYLLSLRLSHVSDLRVRKVILLLCSQSFVSSSTNPRVQWTSYTTLEEFCSCVWVDSSMFTSSLRTTPGQPVVSHW